MCVFVTSVMHKGSCQSFVVEACSLTRVYSCVSCRCTCVYVFVAMYVHVCVPVCVHVCAESERRQMNRGRKRGSQGGFCVQRKEMKTER